MASRLVRITRVRRCLEEAKGGLELAWRGDAALALQRICDDTATRTGGDGGVLPVEITGHTTPAVADIGRASLRVRFITSVAATSSSSSSTTSPTSTSSAAPTGGLLLGIRRSPNHRWLPAIAAAPGEKGPDRYDNSREGLAELMIMARPTVVGDEKAKGEEAKEEEDENADVRISGEGRQNNKHRAKNTSCLVTCLDDETLRAWLPVGHTAAQVTVLCKVTDFHLGLNANRWLKIRMKQIADGHEPLLGDVYGGGGGGGGGRGDVGGGGGGGGDDISVISELLRDTGLGLDPSGAVFPRPADASHLFEHWGAGGNTGISGQVTGYEFEAGVIH